MEFEWDDQKAERNLVKHGVPFEYAARVFLDPNRFDREETRRDYREERRLALGEIEGRLFAIAWTPRGGRIRLIAARKANGRKREKYDEALST